MENKSDLFERRLLQTMSYLNRPWKIVLVFDLIMLVLAVTVMWAVNGFSQITIFLIIGFSTIFSYLVSRILITYHRLGTAYLAELERVNHELAKKNADLEAFSFTTVHDLKTPLASILGYTYLLREKLGDDLAARADAIDQIETSAVNMAGIIDELLMLANVGASEIQLRPIEMEEVVLKSIRRLDTIVKDTNATIKKPADWPNAVGHAPWVEEVWVNYISNALKYGGTPPVLVLGADPGNGKTRFWVTDNGNGIPPGDEQKIFKEFTRLHGQDKEGHGLGLAIVRRIVEKLDGEVGVESRTGKGSTFYFTLPSHLP